MSTVLSKIIDGEIPGTVAHYTALDGRGGFVIIETDAPETLYDATLAYQRKRPGRPWEPPQILVVGPSALGIGQHAIGLDDLPEAPPPEEVAPVPEEGTPEAVPEVDDLGASLEEMLGEEPKPAVGETPPDAAVPAQPEETPAEDGAQAFSVRYTSVAVKPAVRQRPVNLRPCTMDQHQAHA